MAKTKHRYPCDICGHPFKRDEISFAEDNEFGLDLCPGCLKGQRELDVQEEREVDLDFVRDARQEIREMQELKRREL
jgi:hypothetical protein